MTAAFDINTSYFAFKLKPFSLFRNRLHFDLICMAFDLNTLNSLFFISNGNYFAFIFNIFTAY